MNTPKKTIIALSVGVLMVVAILVFSFTENPREIDENTEPNTINEQPKVEEPNILEGVNPEEKNLITKTAGLPFENDEYAITYRFNKSSPHGVILVVIDKTNANGTSLSVREKALNYLEAHRVLVSTLDIEFKGIGNVR